MQCGKVAEVCALSSSGRIKKKVVGDDTEALKAPRLRRGRLTTTVGESHSPPVIRTLLPTAVYLVVRRYVCDSCEM